MAEILREVTFRNWEEFQGWFLENYYNRYEIAAYGEEPNETNVPWQFLWDELVRDYEIRGEAAYVLPSWETRCGQRMEFLLEVESLD